MKRLTFDFDFNKLIDKTYIKKSNSKKGLHLIVWFKEDLTDFEFWYFRLLFGDDIKRIAKDIEKKIRGINHTQVLFDKKFYVKGGGFNALPQKKKKEKIKKLKRGDKDKKI